MNTKEIAVFEGDVLESLNLAQNVHSLLLTAINLLTESVNTLIFNIFRKDDHSMKYVIEPLLKNAGPLSELSVRLKLIYALGLITLAEYEDITLLMAMLNQLNHDKQVYLFTDDKILGLLNSLHSIQLPQAARLTDKKENANTVLQQMQQQRHQQMIRSALILSINNLVIEIINKKLS